MAGEEKQPDQRTDLQRRNADIVSARLRGISEAQVANTFSISERHVRRILDGWRKENPGLRHDDPLDIVDDLLANYQSAVEELAITAATSDNASAKVGAIRARVETLSRIAELLQAIGVMPHNLGKLRVEFDVRYVAEQIVTILDDEDVPDHVQHRLLEVLARRSN